MGKLYFAVDTKQYTEILKTENIFPTIIDKGSLVLTFTEDKKYWMDKIIEQADLDNIEDYKYSVLIEFEIEASILNSLITDPAVGRLSDNMYEYYRKLNKKSTIKKLISEETNILCITDVYETSETPDGISQIWTLKVDSINNKVWTLFCENIHTITCVGEIPGASGISKQFISGI